MGSIYQKLFSYYITSEPYFTWPVEWFSISTDLIGECGKEKLPFESSLYRQWQERLNREGDYWFELSNAKIRYYFNNIENNNILSLVIFAHWLKLPEAKIKELSRMKIESNAQQLLFRFIVSADDIYFIRLPDGKELEAMRKGDTLIADGTVYEID